MSKITSVIAREEDGNIQLTFTIPYILIKKAQDETVAEMAKDTEVAGFRKGNAPMNKVREKIPEATLVEHSLGHILPKALADSVDEHKLRLAIYPKYELVSAKDGQDWQIRATTCELPEVVLGDYKKFLPKDKKLEKEAKEQAVIKSLVDNIKIKIPKILISEEADSRLSNLLGRLEKLGLALETYLTQVNKKPEDLRAEYATQARDAISLDLILSKVAEVEKITADPKEVADALKVADQKDLDERRRLIESILKRRKALDFLINLV